MARTKLDPTKEVTKFTTDHVSIIDKPENDREFIVIQDSYTMSLGEAVAEAMSVLGPLIDKVRAPSRDAILSLNDYLMGRLSDGMMDKKPMPMMAEFSYPDPDTIYSVIEQLNNLPELPDEIAGNVQELLDFLNDNYTSDVLELDDTVRYYSSSTVRSSLNSLVITRSATGEAVQELAALALAVADDPTKGVLVEKGTVLWNLLDEANDVEAEEVNSDDEVDGSVDNNVNSEPTEEPEVSNDNVSIPIGATVIPEDDYTPVRSLFEEMVGRYNEIGSQLTYEQKVGIARHYFEQMGNELQRVITGEFQRDIETSQPQTQSQPQIDLTQLSGVVRNAVQEATEELRIDIETLKRGIPERERIPTRRSFTPRPFNGHSSGGSQGANPSQLASGNW